MSIANSRTRRAEPRTAKDLEARGYKLLTAGRPTLWGEPEYINGRRNRAPMEYYLAKIQTKPWVYGERQDPAAPVVGLIKGPPGASTAHLRKTGTRCFSRRRMGTYESRVAA